MNKYPAPITIRADDQVAAAVERISGEQIPPMFSVRLSDEAIEQANQIVASLSRPGLTVGLRDAIQVALVAYAAAGKTSSNKTWAVRDALAWYAKGGADAEKVNPLAGQVSGAGFGK